MWVQGLWDQEDMWGAIHCYLALKAKGQADHNYLVMGPWRHSQVNYDGYNLGPSEVGRRHRAAVPPRRAAAVLRPVSEARRAQGRHAAGVHLQHRREPLGPARRLAAGLRTGLRRADEAALSAGGLRPGLRQAGGRRRGARTPMCPIPPSPFPTCRGRCASPIRDRWKHWLVTDQRAVADRTDVLTYQTPVLTAPVRIGGAPIADLFAATTGTDADWVVKLIDVFPDEVPSQPEMGGYELAVSMDIFRGRYRESFEHPSADPGRQAAALSLRAADRQPRLPAGPPDHGADPVELVPALRPQPADVRREHLFRQAGRLREGDVSRFFVRRTGPARSSSPPCKNRGVANYAVVIHEEPEGGFWAEVPALPGCYSQGDSIEELMDNGAFRERRNPTRRRT